MPEEAVERLTSVGKWLAKYGEPVYGTVDRIADMEVMLTGAWTRKGNVLYYWVTRWPGSELAIGGLRGKLRKAALLPDGKPLAFTQTKDRLVIRGLPNACPDKIASAAVIRMEFAAVPRQVLGAGYVVL